MKTFLDKIIRNSMFYNFTQQILTIRRDQFNNLENISHKFTLTGSFLKKNVLLTLIK
jgi:hypothetical protein